MTTWYERYLAAWNTLDPEQVLAWMTDDIVYKDITLGHGASGAADEEIRRTVVQ